MPKSRAQNLQKDIKSYKEEKAKTKKLTDGEYPYNWHYISKIAKKRDNYQCQICENKTRRLEVHHIDGEPRNSVYDNLITLCFKCHNKVEGKEYLKSNLLEISKLNNLSNPWIQDYFEIC